MYVMQLNISVVQWQDYLLSGAP